MNVWCVWTEWGEYEQFSRDLRGIFSTSELAETHAEQLRGHKSYDLVEVVADTVLDSLPVDVPYIAHAAHIRPDGSEDTGLGYHRGEKFRTFSNEVAPVHESKLVPWTRHQKPDDLYIQVIGSDEEAVAEEYARLLARAREQLKGSSS